MEYDITDLDLPVEVRDEQLRWLRANDPVHWDEKNGYWLITKHADVLSISKHTELFSSAPKGPWHVFDGSGISIQALDGPEHHDKRRIVSGLFTPRMVRRLEALARRVIDEEIDAVEGKGGCDFVDSFSVPVPMRVIAEMVGVADHDLDHFRRWSDDIMLGPASEGEGDSNEVATLAFGSLSQLFTAEIESRRREPRDDILTNLVQAADAGRLREDGDRMLGETELSFFGPFLVLAGNETTRHAISYGMLALLEHPEEMERLSANPALLPQAADEILRWTTIVRAMRRVAMQDTELRGKRIAKGDSVVMVYASANRDEEVFDDPFRFRIDRDPNEHVALGTGPHYCLGANLARMEIQVVIERVLARLPSLRLEPGTRPVMGEHSIVRAVEKMPVVF
ncbi:MAG: cytochrome P450 [Proteobacteria bacterium]|nr:cytochrome P450 [Pseudomonadota bacterium]